MAKFKLGQEVMTKGVAEAIEKNEKFAKEVIVAFLRYKKCDWGDLCKDDKEMNDEAVKLNNDRIVAKYNTCEGGIFIITEYDRSVTTILFTSEY